MKANDGDGSDPEFDPEASLRSPAKRVVGVILTVVVLLGVAVGGKWFLNKAAVAAEDTLEPICEGIPGSTPELEEIYSATLPSWFLATQTPGPDEIAARERLVAALAPEFAEVVEELAVLRKTRTLGEALEREYQLIDEWNAANVEQGIPWRLRLPMNPRVREASLFALSYCIAAQNVATGEGRSGQTEVPVLFAARADNIGVVEGYSGHAQEIDREAFIIVDRLAESAANDLWPLFAEPDDRTSGISTAWTEVVTAELGAQLDPSALETLRRTAVDRRTLVRLRDGLHERAACGASFIIQSIPLRGFTRQETDSWRTFASSSSTAGCRNFTFAELDEAAEASARLRDASGLRAAVRELAALHANNIAYHEVRHVLDRPERPCPSCGLDENAVQELSAYMASFAAGPIPYTEAYEGCLLLQGRSRQHARALRFAFSRLLPGGCDSPPPEGFAESAQALEPELFGDATVVEWSEEIPRSVRSRAF